MKTLIFVFLIFVSFNCISQDFAPIGAKWYYTEGYAFSGDIDYLKIESIKDTLFQGKNCKLLIKTGLLECSNRPATEIVYSKDSTVYFWDNDFKDFQVLFDFKTKKDSSWFIKIKNRDNVTDTIIVTVDSITKQKIINNTLKTLNVTYHPKYKGIDINFYYSSKIIYSIGDFSYLFNLYPASYLACDINYSGGLRCYIDSNIGHYSTGIADSCTYTHKWTDIKNMKDSKSKIDLFPNPTSGHLWIDCKTENINSYVLFDNYGKMIKTSTNGKTDIDISNYPDGLYFITIIYSNGLVDNKKIIKINAR